MRVKYFYKDVDGYPCYGIGETELYIGEGTEVRLLGVEGDTGRHFTKWEAELEVEGDFRVRLEKFTHTGREGFSHRVVECGEGGIVGLRKVRVIFKGGVGYIYEEEREREYRERREGLLKEVERVAEELSKGEYREGYERFYERYKDRLWWYGGLRNYALDYPEPGLSRDIAIRRGIALGRWGYMDIEAGIRYLGEEVGERVRWGGLTGVAVGVEGRVIEVPQRKGFEDFLVELRGV